MVMIPAEKLGLGLSFPDYSGYISFPFFEQKVLLRDIGDGYTNREIHLIYKTAKFLGTKVSKQQKNQGK